MDPDRLRVDLSIKTLRGKFRRRNLRPNRGIPGLIEDVLDSPQRNFANPGFDYAAYRRPRRPRRLLPLRTTTEASPMVAR